MKGVFRSSAYREGGRDGGAGSRGRRPWSSSARTGQAPTPSTKGLTRTGKRWLSLWTWGYCAALNDGSSDSRGRGLTRAESARKSGGGAVNLQITAWAAAFCKSVGVCLRRFESCTCHTAKRASDQHVCRSGALRRTPWRPVLPRTSARLPHRQP
jgi:hypothetical protein